MNDPAPLEDRLWIRVEYFAQTLCEKRDRFSRLKIVCA